MEKINRLFLFLVLFAVKISLAQDGTLDQSFGGSGYVTTAFNGYDSSISSLAVQSDGKILAIGGISDSSGYSQFILERYNSDGSVDSTFGTQGNVTSDFLGFEISGFSMYQQSDDKIVVGGTSKNTNQFFLLRFNTDGNLDPGFGIGGIVTTNLSLTSPRVLQMDGRITFVGTLNQSSLVFIRYNQDGVLDTGFGNNGIVDNPMQDLSPTNYATIQNDGKMLVVWRSVLNDSELQVMRFNPDGSVDFAFGGTGTGTVIIGVDSAAGGSSSFLKVQKDGKILVLANSTITRLLPDGNLDTGFGVHSTLISEGFEGGRPTAVELQSDGKIVVGGFYNTVSAGSAAINDVVLVRFLDDGTLDSTFGNNGIAKYPTGVDSFANALSIQADGKILAGGSIGAPHADFAVWRYTSATLSNAKFDALDTSFKVYPNPVKENFNLDFSLNDPANLSINLYDNLGRNISNLLKSKDFQAGYNNQQLELPGSLSHGIYFLNISDGKNTSTVKIVK